MEKYCPNCGRVLGEVDFKFCPYCKSELNERVGRQPIPSNLRHAVLKRDNYRCVECGATNKETTLEIDHIVPVAKGGTNDISNLQTLCKDCNRAKSATVWDSKSDLLIKKEQLNHLQNRLSDYEFKLNHATTEDEEIEYKFEIHRLNEKILNINQVIEELAQKEKEREEKFNKKQEMKRKKNIFFKKLYLELDDFCLTCLSLHFSVFNHVIIPNDYNLFDNDKMPSSFRENLIKWIVKNYDEEEIHEGLKLVEKNNIYAEEILKNYNAEFLSELSDNFMEYGITDEKKLCYLLVNKYSINEIKGKIQKIEEKTEFANILKEYPEELIGDLSVYLFKKPFLSSQMAIEKIASEFPKEKINETIKEVKKFRQSAKEIYSLYDEDIYYEGLSDFYSSRHKRFAMENYSSYEDMIYGLICVYSVREIKDRLNSIVFQINSIKKLSENLSDLTLENLCFYYEAPVSFSKTKKLGFMLNKSGEDEIIKLIEYFDDICYKINPYILSYLIYSFKPTFKNLKRKEKFDFIIQNYSPEVVNKTIKSYYDKKSFLDEMNNKLDEDFLSRFFFSISEPEDRNSKRNNIKKIIKTKSLNEIRLIIDKVNEDYNVKTRYCSHCLSKADNNDKFCVNCGKEVPTKDTGLFSF